MILENSNEIIATAENERQLWKKIWFTNGCFDILHPGHIETFKQAKKYCDILFVALNWDKSPYWKTKPWRPIHNEKHREIILDSIKYIDYVVKFDEETPIERIKEIKPDYIFKGWDYKAEDVVWYKEVKENWWEVIIIPTVEWYSTTNSVNKILWNKKN